MACAFFSHSAPWNWLTSFLRIFKYWNPSSGARGACAAAAMRAVGLEEASGKPVGKYSLGMRQRLGIAQAIMEHPRLLVLDEPMNGLDHKGAADMRRLFSSWREQGTTILLSSHNPLDISELCDTVCEMDAGVLKPVQ